MKRTIPAVYFQKQLDGTQRRANKPKVLELFESQLRTIMGGSADNGIETDTFTGSQGWADVEPVDDCGR